MTTPLAQRRPLASAAAEPRAIAEPPPRRGNIAGLLWRGLLLLILALTFLPFLFMVMTSLKTTHQFYHNFWLPAWPPAFGNYAMAFGELAPLIVNSLFVTAFSIAGIVGFSVVSGFLFARYEFPGRETIYYMMLAMMMIPGSLMLIPAFVWVQRLGLLDTYWVMILPYVAGGQVLGTYLMRGFFSELENDLFEAAQMDGAGLLRQLWHVAIPLSLPVVGVVAIISSIGVWNNYLWPLVTTTSENVMVLTVGMQRFVGLVGGASGSGGLYGVLYAGYAISMIPLSILFAFCTRVFMKGITAGALKA